MNAQQADIRATPGLRGRAPEGGQIPHNQVGNGLRGTLKRVQPYEDHIARFVSANRDFVPPVHPWGPRPRIAGKGRTVGEAIRALSHSPAAWALGTAVFVLGILNAHFADGGSVLKINLIWPA